MTYVVAGLGIALVVALVVLFATVVDRQQRRMRGGAPDLRRGGDQDPPFDDYGRGVG